MGFSSHEIRKKYITFLESRGHTGVPSSSLIPENDPTTLFTGSGMQPMIPYLLGEKHPVGKRICNSQKAFRASDIEDIGDNRHTTFFEMLGNWSLGDYFKKQQIEQIFAFYVDELGLDPKKISISVYRGNKKLSIGRDDESVEIWKKLFAGKGIDAKAVDFAEKNGMQDGKIFYYDEKENRWSRSGVPQNMPVGELGGPDSEMFWDFGEEHGFHENSQWKNEPCHPACDCGRFLEFANNVFMQYQSTKDGFIELKNKSIDFGGGLERIAVALQDQPDVFLGDLFSSLRKKLEEISLKKYGQNPEETKAFRIIMDHLRAATFLICDGAVPSNKDQGYFTRRLIRRALRFAKTLSIQKGFSQEIAHIIIDEYGEYYTQLAQNKSIILDELHKEETQFLATLEKGLKEFEKLVSKIQKSDTPGRDFLSGEDAFYLYQTYGFPIEMIEELANEKGLLKGSGFGVSQSDFDKAFLVHQEKSRAGSQEKFSGGLVDNSEHTIALHSATHLMLAGLRKYLGNDVHQKGCNITPERLRFDFNYGEKVERDVLDKVEVYVNEAIQKGCKVEIEEMDKQVAKDSGVEGSFWERYPNIVKVYVFKADDGSVYSRELCGGPHVEDTKNMGKFQIKKEESSSRGIRRIKAVLIK